MPVEDDGQESPCKSWGEAMARTLWVVGHATSMPLDACESPARACAQSAQSDELYGIDEATMRSIVKDPQCTVQSFFAGGSLFFSRRSLQGNPVPRRESRHGIARNPTVPHLPIRSENWYRVGLASPCSERYTKVILRERRQQKKLYEELAMSDTIEIRLARVERELAILRSKSTRDKSNWLSEITGSFKDDPHFEEIVRLGKEMRDAEQPEYE